VSFSVEPFDSSSMMLPVYNAVASKLQKALGCTVQLTIDSNYTAEVVAMESGKLDVAEFGPLGYVLAHTEADAQAVAQYATANGTAETYTASIVTWPGSGITSLAQVAGKSFAYSDPASTSGYLFPAYALTQDGINPSTGVQAEFAGSHTASYEALVNHHVQAGELNSQTITSEQDEGEYTASDFVTLWQSQPIPADPIAIYGKLSSAFKTKLTNALLSLNLASVSDPDAVLTGVKLVTATDSEYDVIRSVATTLKLTPSQMLGG
jgi:phosphonate transport system substrate-binding protein